MSQPLLIHVTCSGVEGKVLFEGRLRPKKSPSPRGVFDLMADGIQTPLGLSLKLDAFYDASIDNGNLTISTFGKRLLFVSPLCREFGCELILPTEEVISVSAS